MKTKLHIIRAITIAVFGPLLILVPACSTNNSNSPQAAAPPTVSTLCITSPASCNAAGYSAYPGFSPYPGYNTGYGFYGYSGTSPYVPMCDCPSGSVPVYNGSLGLGCMQQSYYSPVQFGAYQFYLQPSNYQWVNWGQISNTSGYGGSGCSGAVTQTCIVGQAGVCPTGYSCHLTAPASNLGVCASP